MRVLALGILCLCLTGCVTQGTLQEARKDVMREVGPIAEAAAVRHGVEEATAEKIGETAEVMAGSKFDNEVEEHKSNPWAAIGGTLMALLQLFIQSRKVV